MYDKLKVWSFGAGVFKVILLTHLVTNYVTEYD